MLKLIKTHLMCVLMMIPAIIHPEISLAGKGDGLTMKYADDLYKDFAYSDAAGLYQRVLKKDPKNYKALNMLASCYRKMNDQKNAEKYYAKVVEFESTEPENYLFYAMALEANGKGAEAKPFYEKFHKNANMDKRGERKLKTLDALNLLYADSAYFKVTPYSFNTKEDDYSPAYCPEGITFVSNGFQEKFVRSIYPWKKKAFSDLYITRSFDQTDSIFTLPRTLSVNLNSRYNEGPVGYDGEGRTLAFTRNAYYNRKLIRGKNGTNHLNIYLASDKMHDWKNIKPVNINNADYSVCHPTLSNDGKTMYFVSDMQGGFGGMDIYKSTFDGSKWSDPVNLGIQINTEGNDAFPNLIRDSVLYYASNGKGGLGGYDIYAAVIKNGQISTVENAGYPINTVYDDFGLIYNPAKKIGFFSSNRPGGKGGDDLYRFRYLKPDFTIKFIIKDQDNGSLLSGVKVKITDKKGKIIKEAETGKDGVLQCPAEKTGEYLVTLGKEKYFDQAMPVKPDAGDGLEKIVETSLYRDMGFTLLGLVTDAETGAVLSESRVTILDARNGADVFSGQTDQTGSFRKSLQNFSLNQQINYEIRLEKEGYFTKSVIYNKQLSKSGDISLNDDINLGLTKVKVGLDIGKLINLNPIYYDIGKFDIREDAAAELDKVAKAMEDNPSLIIELGSHTDSRSAAKANLQLSDKRARAAVDYIVSRGIDKSRITGKGYGESKLINRCKDGVKCKEEEHQQNRRTEFKIVKM